MIKKLVYAVVIACLTTTVALAGSFTWGYCTWGVASVKGTYNKKIGNYELPWSGNAKDWCTNAKNAGYSTSKTESVRAIVVFPGWSANSYGHVGIVTSAGIMKSMNDLGGLGNWTSNRAISTFPNKKSPVKPSCYITYPK
jgi:hypothetical protein